MKENVQLELHNYLCAYQLYFVIAVFHTTQWNDSDYSQYNTCSSEHNDSHAGIDLHSIFKHPYENLKHLVFFICLKFLRLYNQIHFILLFFHLRLIGYIGFKCKQVDIFKDLLSSTFYYSLFTGLDWFYIYPYITLMHMF